MAKETKFVLITGCSTTSLGTSIALEFLKQPHYHVFATALSLDELSGFSSLSNVTPLALDVTSHKSIEAAASSIAEQTGGKLDVLINNAGIWHRGPLIEANMDEVRSIFETNVVAPLAMSKAFANMLVKAKGHILNIGSVTSYSAIIWQGPYNASKAAITSLTNTLRYELSPLGVSVTLLTLGAVQTGLHSNERPLSTVLDKTSYYAPIVDTIEYETSSQRLHSFGVPREGIAREVVKHVLKRNGKGEIWLGGLVWMYWILKLFGLLGLLDWLGARERGGKKLVEARGKMKGE